VNPEQLEITNSAQLTLTFDPPIQFPAYMLASKSQQSRRRKLKHISDFEEWSEALEFDDE